VAATPLLSSEIDFISLIIFTADENKMCIITGYEFFGAVITCPLTAVRLASRHPRLAWVVGMKNEAEAKQLHFNPQSRQLPPRLSDNDLIRDHESLRSWTGVFIG